jgi:hypothetical protein
MESNILKHLSTGEPKYWPSDRNKLPDLVGFCATKSMPQDFALTKSCFDLSSYHSPILITPIANALNQENEQIWSNRHTNWDDFRCLVNERLPLNIPLKTEKDIDTAAKFFIDTIQCAGWNVTPEHKRTLKAHNCLIIIKQKIEDRRIHGEWHRLRAPASKRLLNTATKELKELHDNKNHCIQAFLQGLRPTESTDYSLWKTTKKLKHVKIFSATMDIRRNMGQKECRKSICRCFSATSIR